MIALAAFYRQHYDAAALSAAARTCCAVPLRRAGAMTELVLTGVHACLDSQPPRPTALIWGSRTGIRHATARVVGDLCISGEAPMPFDFLATQPALAAVPVQQTFPCVVNAVYQPWQAEADAHWARMLHLAIAWLQSGRHERVLCAQVEPATEHPQGDWLVLQRGDGAAWPEVQVGLADGTHGAGSAALFDWLEAGIGKGFVLRGADALPALRFYRAGAR
ncbi:hypothetical protein [Azoarcus olearius]|uniref:Uncharacterized protein n=1 Tax=Azoarcus sp. (strain BH72) TaxID=418699 RepID=A1K245_AZOSB|nr:hypothetical protein [Azoarcus olearius]CAL92900.1 hypothetical protein predicted by Glimmer/Critica [Azoarcus olearius]